MVPGGMVWWYDGEVGMVYGFLPIIMSLPTHAEVELGCANRFQAVAYHLLPISAQAPAPAKKPKEQDCTLKNISDIYPFTHHYDIFGGELYFSPIRGCPRVLPFCM